MASCKLHLSKPKSKPKPKPKPKPGPNSTSNLMSQTPEELLPGLPEDLALDCLLRLHPSSFPSASSVSRRWRCLITSRDFYYLRKRNEHTHLLACLIQTLPVTGSTGSGSDLKSAGPLEFGISVFDLVSRKWDRVDLVPEYANKLPLFCQVSSTEGKLVLMGGWDPVSYEPMSSVFVYDFGFCRWRKGKDMPEKRSFFAAGGVNGRIYIAGGHDPVKNALRSAWVYDVNVDEWSELGPMSEDRDECEGLVIGSEFWVVSGYASETQGRFRSSGEAYDVNKGQWQRVEDAWAARASPRGCIGIGFGGDGLVNWGESSAEVRVGSSAVELGGQVVLVSGSPSQGSSRGFYLVKRRRVAEETEFERVDVPDEFSGYVQSGCCVEV